MVSGKKALVVEGGAMRGIFASGVLDAFMEQNYRPFDFVMGVSAGASNLVGYLAHQPKRSYQVITELATSKRFYNPGRFLRGGSLVDVRWLIDEANEHYPIDEERLFSSVPFFAAATNINTGKADYYQVTRENFVTAIEATSALPLVYKNTPCFSGGCYTDGGVADSIPVKEAYRRGARDITVILSHPLSYTMNKPKSEWMMKKLFARYPQVANSVVHRAEKYNGSLQFIHHPPKGANIEVIAPPENFAVKRLTMKKPLLQQGYQMGLNAGKQYLQSMEKKYEFI
ncbi:patatin-like phospholipase family protein [Vibrio cincinnatiensis]|uniref:patatin-like phospholipase family protein n=1 Tax=Vibrio cincinnatiensis TaxID=675 RepID=UPI001EDF56BD|nr:patatin family protein [Vibrio cincinnatiensis]MCG3732051.1 patatin family protein [Vibrio cincinnatiensis]MCG3739762.1 patatin family protein [Vibrio cincinnatiensis]